MKNILVILLSVFSFASFAGDLPELNKVAKDARKAGVCLVVYNGMMGGVDDTQLLKVMKILSDAVESHGNRQIADQVLKEMAFIVDDFDLMMEYGKNYGCFDLTKELVSKGLI